MVRCLICATSMMLVLGWAGTPIRADETTGRSRARFRILVPDEAFVFVARVKTSSMGTERVFESPPLLPGRQYQYEISVIHEGREFVRQVSFEAGNSVEVDFRNEFRKAEAPQSSQRPYKPIRPEWLPRRVWRA